MTRIFLKSVQILVLLSLVFTVGCKKDKDDDIKSKESPDVVTFSDGKIPASWQADGWNVDNTEGCGNNFSLTPSATGGTLICYKTGTDNINGIQFYLKGDGSISFYIDGEKEEECLADVNDWIKFSFTFLTGEHEYKWEYSPAESLQKRDINLLLDSILFCRNVNVGSYYKGGIIVCLPENGQPGLIAAPTSFSQKYTWSIDDVSDHCVVTYAFETEYGKGKENTERIVQIQGEGNYAAKVCYDLDLNGYTDWFLPSIGEYQKMVEVGDRLNFPPPDGYPYIHGGLFHWTSSEDNNSLYARYYAWSGKINNLGQLTFDSNFGKTSALYVRAVRYF